MLCVQWGWWVWHWATNSEHDADDSLLAVRRVSCWPDVGATSHGRTGSYWDAENFLITFLDAQNNWHDCQWMIIDHIDYISREAQLRWNVYWSWLSVCLCVFLSVPHRIPHYCMDPDVTWGNSRGCPLVVHYWPDLKSVHGFCCYEMSALYSLMCLVYLYTGLMMWNFCTFRYRNEFSKCLMQPRW